MKKKDFPDCARCSLHRTERICMNRKGKASNGCPTVSKKKLVDQAKNHYENPEILEFARQASIQEGVCYAGRNKKPYVICPTKPRIQEICEFTKKMGYARLGLIFCVGLAKEAKIFGDIFKNHGLKLSRSYAKLALSLKKKSG